MNAKLSENLKKERLKLNMSQEYVAEKINKTRGTYSRYENGTLEPDINTLIMLADLYHVSIDYLTGRVSITNEIANALIPGYPAGQKLGDVILRRRATKRSKKAAEQKEDPTGNPEGK